MSDINWDENARKAVSLFYDFIDEQGVHYASPDKMQKDFFNWLTLLEPCKTVEDAVEFYNSEFPDELGVLGIAYSNNKIIPYYSGSPLADGTNSPESYIICTREEFEAYVKEQESEKWTHIYLEEKAYVKVSEPDCDGYILVVTEDGGYNLAKPDELKPIKPTITEKERETVAKFIARVWSKDNPDLRKEFDDFCNEHELKD